MNTIILNILFYCSTCSCYNNPTTDWSFIYDTYSEIYIGEVTTCTDDHGYIKCLVDVEDVIKGKDELVKTIRTPDHPNACGISFQEGDKYILYTYKKASYPGFQYTNRCNRTTKNPTEEHMKRIKTEMKYKANR